MIESNIGGFESPARFRLVEAVLQEVLSISLAQKLVFEESMRWVHWNRSGEFEKSSGYRASRKTMLLCEQARDADGLGKCLIGKLYDKERSCKATRECCDDEWVKHFSAYGHSDCETETFP